MVLALAASAVVAQIVLGQQTPVASLSANGASPAASRSAGATAGQTAMAANAIYRQAAPGVVTITTQTGRLRGGEGTGSGIVLDRNGDILTNAHVVAGANQLQVMFSDGQTVAASIVNTNPSADLAVIRVSVASSSLHPLTLGNSGNVLIGDTVYAIGAPFGHPESMSNGIISGLNRTDPASGLHGLIQTDARINPGNSGGPLLNTVGQVIGINVAIQSPVAGSVGVGFAIPINSAKQIIAGLEANE